MPKRKITFDPELATEAKSLVALAFRNGLIEDVHAGKDCPPCAGKSEYSHITQDEMKNIMKQAVDTTRSTTCSGLSKMIRRSTPGRFCWAADTRNCGMTQARPKILEMRGRCDNTYYGK